MGLRIPWHFIFRITGFRKRRMQLFEQIMQPTDETHIIDIGGTSWNWNYINSKPKITLVNINEKLKEHNYPDHISFQAGNALNLQFKDYEFDIAFSNSVIEHVSTWENQIQFVKEMNRVGKRIWIQTPAKEFFLEPHLITPFIHWLPEVWKIRMLRNFTLWGWIRRPNQKQVDHYIQTVRLINYNEMKLLFPHSNIRIEKWLGLPRAYIAYT